MLLTHWICPSSTDKRRLMRKDRPKLIMSQLWTQFVSATKLWTLTSFLTQWGRKKLHPLNQWRPQLCSSAQTVNTRIISGVSMSFSSTSVRNATKTLLRNSPRVLSKERETRKVKRKVRRKKINPHRFLMKNPLCLHKRYWNQSRVHSLAWKTQKLRISCLSTQT